MRPAMVVVLLTLVSCRQIFGLEPPTQTAAIDAPSDSPIVAVDNTQTGTATLDAAAVMSPSFTDGIASQATVVVQ